MKQNIFRKTINSSRDLTADNINVQNLVVENELTCNGAINLPGVVFLNEVQTLTAKTMNGEQNTFLNIPNSSLSSGIDAAKISSGVVSNTEFDYLNNVTSNIQTQLNDRVTLTGSQTVTNKVLAFGSNSMTDVMSLNTTQSVTSPKLFTSALNVDALTGSLSVREDNSDVTFRHCCSYGQADASFRIATSDNAIIRTGVSIGKHGSDARVNAFDTKYYLSFLSGANTSTIDIEGINFLNMTSSNFNLNNLNNINVGTGTKIGSIRQDAAQGNITYITYLPTGSNVELKYLESMSGNNIQTQLNSKASIATTETITGKKTFETASNNDTPVIIKSTTGSTTGIAFQNVSSVNNAIINRSNNDISITLENVERFKFQADNNINLVNGGSIQYNSVALKDVSETLTNKTISFASNTLTNVCSTNTSQSITETKNFTPLKLTIDNELVVKNRITTSAPGVNDDNTLGYSIGSSWYRSNRKSFYKCQSTDTGNATWYNLNIRDITFSYFSTTSASYLPYVYFFAGQLPYNRFTVYTYGDGDHYVQLYNVTTSVVIQESAVIGSGNNTVTTTITGFPLFITSSNIIRAETKSVTGGQTTGIFCMQID